LMLAFMVGSGGAPGVPGEALDPDRTLHAAAMGAQGTLALGLLPAQGINPSHLALLGGLVQLADQCHALHQALDMPRTPSEWHALLLGLVDTWFLARTPAQWDGLRSLQRSLGQWHERALQAGYEGPLGLTVVQASLAPELEAEARAAVPSGAVTFASMDGLRNLPYRVIAMVGMDDGAFPPRDASAEFDLMATAPQPGDPRPRLEGRQHMLDLMIAARDHVWIYYSGHDLRDNSERPPAVVSELIDLLASAEGVTPDVMRQALTTLHPLQPFSAGLYAADTPVTLQSYHEGYAQALAQSLADSHHSQLTSDTDWRSELDPEDLEDEGPPADAANDSAPTQAQGTLKRPDRAPFPMPSTSATPLWMKPLAPVPPSSEPITLGMLQRFWVNPAEAWLRQRLGVSWHRSPDVVQDDEPMEVDARQRARLISGLMPHALLGADTPTLHALARAMGQSPSGAWGEPWQALAVADAQALAARLPRTHPAALPQTQVISIQIEGQQWPVALSVDGPWHQEGLVRWQPGERRARHALRAWLDHVVCQALLAASPREGQARTTSTYWISRDDTLVLPPVVDALMHLHALVRGMIQGLSAPLPFMPEASLARAISLAGSDARPPVHHADEQDPFVALAWRGHPPFTQHADFDAWARQIFGPLLQAAPGLAP
jgi:exodeoxyribonuclease V gamma subunit